MRADQTSIKVRSRPQARVAELRAEVVALRGAAAGGGVAASEARIRELAAQLEDVRLCGSHPALTSKHALQLAAALTVLACPLRVRCCLCSRTDPCHSAFTLRRECKQHVVIWLIATTK